ncbi:hypothetical protein LIER_26993 [Lithospermum erythrorhizon]|uniref:Uncharacterized protein n=1 Tax=Lithospermum erythrorhizon TaxID=34254 RepID=A0AAV3RBM3_LITER
MEEQWKNNATPRVEIYLVHSIEHYNRDVYAQMEDRKIFSKPQKLKSPSNRRDQKRYCEYHRDHGHDTDDFRLLKAEIEKLIQKGHLIEFVKRDQERSPRRQRESPGRNNKPRSRSPPRITRRIDMIYGGLVGGGDTSNSQKQYARRVLYRLAPLETIDREVISFSRGRVGRNRSSHDDPLIISPVIENFLVAKMLVDTGISRIYCISEPMIDWVYPDLEVISFDERQNDNLRGCSGLELG